MGIYLEDRELDSVLEAYFEEGIKDKIKDNKHYLNTTKGIYKINERLKELIGKKDYKYYYITIINSQSKNAIGGNGYASEAIMDYCVIRLYGSNDKKFASDDFDHQTGQIKYQYKDESKRLLQNSMYRKIEKDDIDSSIRKYIVSYTSNNYSKNN